MLMTQEYAELLLILLRHNADSPRVEKPTVTETNRQLRLPFPSKI